MCLVTDVNKLQDHAEGKVSVVLRLMGILLLISIRPRLYWRGLASQGRTES